MRGGCLAGQGRSSTQVAFSVHEVRSGADVVSEVRAQAGRELRRHTGEPIAQHVDFRGLLVPMYAPQIVRNTPDRYELEAELNVRDVQCEPIVPVRITFPLRFIIRTSG